jgi:hypothetical protein
MANLADVLRQGGYIQDGQIVRQPSQTAQTINQYGRNVISNAGKNLTQQRADVESALTMGPEGIQIGDFDAYTRLMQMIPSLGGITKSGKGLVPSAYEQAFEIEKRTGTKIKPEEVSKIQQIYDMMAKERQLKTMKPSDFPRWGDITKTADDDLAMIADLQKKVDQQKVLDMMQAEKVSRREILEKQLKNIKK